MLGVFTQLFENNAMLHIYIDESGDLGVCGSYFFVMAAVVFLCDSSAKRGTRLVRKMRKRMGVNELKSSRMGFIERQAALNKLMLIRDVEFFYLIATKLIKGSTAAKDIQTLISWHSIRESLRLGISRNLRKTAYNFYVDASSFFILFPPKV